MDESRVAGLVAEIYDPARDLTSAAAARVPRLYHSVAVLLPDGTVITADQSGARRRRAALELFHPPYLFRGLGR